MLDRPRGSPADGRRDPRRPALGNDDAARTSTLCTAAYRPEVVGIGDTVEADEERAISGRELVRVSVAVGLTERDDALMVTRSGLGRQRTLGPDVNPHPRLRAKPGFRRERSLARMELQNLTPARAYDLPDRMPAVDELASTCHELGTSR